MAGVFISYRREDARGHAGWLREGLAERLGRDRVFMDIDTIEPGLDFVEVIEQAVDACEVCLVLIGKEWLTTEGADGRRRIHDPEDYHRLEVESALKRGIRVIPVLVQDATVPRPEELPETLRTLARRHAYELSDSRWTYDVEGLSAIVKQDLDEPEPPRPPGKRLGRSAIVLAACLAGLGVIVAIGLVPGPQSPPPDPGPSGGANREQDQQDTDTPPQQARGATVSVPEGAQRVRFRSGESSTTLEGTLTPGERSKYLLEAQSGQRMTVDIASGEGSAAFTIRKQGGARIGGGESDDAPDWSGELPADGDYEITVEGTGGAASYDLEVGII